MISMITIILSSLLISCEKTPFSLPLKQTEAIELIDECLSAQSGGFALYVNDVVDLHHQIEDSCNLNSECTFNSIAENVEFNHDYASNYNYSLSCDNGISKEFSINLNASGTFESPGLISRDIINANCVLNNLSNTQLNYLLKGFYSREGIVKSKGTKEEYIYCLSLSLSDVIINRKSGNILSGTAKYVLGGVSKGITSESFNYMGEINFEDRKQATLSFQDKEYWLKID
jgi:hypothetical protein